MINSSDLTWNIFEHIADPATERIWLQLWEKLSVLSAFKKMVIVKYCANSSMYEKITIY